MGIGSGSSVDPAAKSINPTQQSLSKAAEAEAAVAIESDEISKIKKQEKNLYRRAINAEDITKHLLDLKKPVTPENKQILMTLFYRLYLC